MLKLFIPRNIALRLGFEPTNANDLSFSTDLYLQVGRLAEPRQNPLARLLNLVMSVVQPENAQNPQEENERISATT